MPEHIRNCTKSDINRIEELELLCFAAPWTREMLLGELRNPAALYRVLEKDGSIIAYAGMWVVADEAYVTNIAVHPDFRGNGYGETILRDLMRAALEKGAGSITLEVRVSNHVAQALYAKLGFAQEGVRKGFYPDNNEDALILWNRNIAAIL